MGKHVLERGLHHQGLSRYMDEIAGSIPGVYILRDSIFYQE